MENKEKKEKKGTISSLTGLIIRLIVTSIILAITSFLTPGFVIVGGLPSIILAAVVISLLDSFAEKLMGIDASPFGRGIKGFVISAIIIYIAQFLVPGMGVTIIGAIFASIVIGIIDAILPGRAL
jgi:putative membrane protein